MMRFKRTFLILGLFGHLLTTASAQYFGKNKANYENINFEVVHTPNFEIYHYLENEACLHQLASNAEQWYQMHQRVLGDTILSKNPIIFYNDHADFQQTNAVNGSIGVGTGGVTEGFKNRVIMPLAMSNQQTQHVLGHELVHAFQYNMILNGDSTSMRNLANLPLWMVEGLAEYLSIGRVDAHTAMWMRDAVLNDDVPTLDELNNPQYFPYRYGQVFWAFLTGLKGDDIIEPFFTGVAKHGLEQASIMVLGISKDNLSHLWVNAIRGYYGPYVGIEHTPQPFTKKKKKEKKGLQAKKDKQFGKSVITSENGGRLNISPVISPNGRYVIFLSEKELFSTDLYLADARSGEVLGKVASAARSGHIDDFSYIESAGSWSPNSKEFAFVAFSKGQNILVIHEALTGKTTKKIRIKDVPAFSNPAWSPDGRRILVSGLVDGQVDLYTVEVKSGKVTRLTNDKYSEVHPHWSEDGKRIVFSTDKLSMDRGRRHGKYQFNLAFLDVETGAIEHLDIFPGADNLNPVLDTAQNVIFLSNRDGFRNIYKYEPTSGKVFQLTDYLTGVSGITQYSPAISIARKRDRLVFSHFYDNGYTIIRANPDDLMNKEVDPLQVDMTPATLPRLNDKAPNIVDAQLDNMDDLSQLPASRIIKQEYKSKFKLDYIAGSAGVGIGTSSIMNTTTGLAGGINALFSDVTGNNQILASAALNGEITDFGGAVAYINRKHKVNYGALLSHLPSRSLRFNSRSIDTLQIGDDLGILTDHWVYDLTRIFEDKVGAFAHLPFSKTLRVEGGANFARYSGRVDRYDYYYDAAGRLIAEDREKIGKLEGFNLYTIETALVGDNSVFGVAAPLKGHRFRVGVERYFGEFEFTAPTIDYRLYKFFKPVGLAFRAYHYGRYGGNAGKLYPLFVGSPWYVRGYNTSTAQNILIQNGSSIDQLLGSKMLVSNFEVRIPFTGPERLSILPSKFLFTDLNFFVDGGLAWNDFDQFGNSNESGFGQAKPVFSAGASVRLNLFGAMVLEPYYAFPIQANTRGIFGMNIIPGW